MAHRVRLAALLLTSALVAPTASADPISIGVAAAAAAFSAAASGVGAGVAAGLSLSAAIGAVSIASVAAAAVVGGALAGLSQALQKQPQKLGATPPNAAIRQPSAVLPYVYGETRVGGFARLYHASENATDTKRHLCTAWVLAAAEIDDILEIYDGDKLMWTKAGGLTSDYKDVVGAVAHVHTRTGASGDDIPAVFLSELPTTLDAAAQAALLADTAGKPVVYIMFLNVSSWWAKGLPQSLWFKVRGHHVHDPRVDERRYSNNLALCAADYVERAAPGIYPYIDQTHLVAAANLCSESVALDGGGTQFRYLLNGAVPSDGEPRSTLVRIMAHAAGQPVWTGARLLLVCGAYSAPIATFARPDFVTPLRITAETLVEEHLDGVTGTFRARANNWNDTGIPEITLDDYDPADGDPRLLSLDLPWIDDDDRAQRVALLTLRQTRRLRRVEFGVPLTSANATLAPGDRVTVTLDTIGLDGVFEIVERSSVYDPAGPRVQITAIEDNSSFWAWSADQATVAPRSLASNLPSTTFVAPPSGVTLAPSARIEPDGSVTPRLRVTWTASADPYLDDYEVRWTQAGVTQSQRTAELTLDLYGLDPAASATVAVHAVNRFGRRSAAATTAAATPGGDVTPPPVPSASVAPVAGGWVVTVAAAYVYPADFSHFEAKEVAAAAASTATAIKTIRSPQSEIRRDSLAPDTARSVYVRAVDRSGNASAYGSRLDVTTPVELTSAEIDAAISTAVSTAENAQADATQALLDAAAAAQDVVDEAAVAAAAALANETLINQEIARIEAQSGADLLFRSTFDDSAVAPWVATNAAALATTTVVPAAAPFGRRSLRLLQAADPITSLRIREPWRNGDLFGRTLRARMTALTSAAGNGRGVNMGIEVESPSGGVALVLGSAVGDGADWTTVENDLSFADHSARWRPVFYIGGPVGAATEIYIYEPSLLDVTEAEDLRAYFRQDASVLAADGMGLATYATGLGATLDTLTGSGAITSIQAKIDSELTTFVSADEGGYAADITALETTLDTLTDSGAITSIQARIDSELTTFVSADEGGYAAATTALRVRYEDGDTVNHVRNSEFRLDTKYWYLTETAGYDYSIRFAASGFSGPGERPLVIRRIGGTADIFARVYASATETGYDATLGTMAVEAGDVVEASANLGASNAAATLTMLWRDAAGAELATVTSSAVTSYVTRAPAENARVVISGAAPAGAKSVTFSADLRDSVNAANDAFLILWRPMLCATTAGADPKPYSANAAQDAALVDAYYRQGVATLANDGLSVAQEIVAQGARIGDAEADISTINTTKVDGAGAVAAVNAQVSAGSGGDFATVSSLATAQKAATDGLSAYYGVKVKAGNALAFVDMLSDAELGSALVLGADAVTIAGDAITLDGNTTVNGDFEINGSLHIGGGTVVTGNLTGSAVTAEKIAVGATSYIYAAASGTDVQPISELWTDLWSDTADVSGRVFGYVSMAIKNVSVSNLGVTLGTFEIIIGSTTVYSAPIVAQSTGVIALFQNVDIALYAVAQGETMKIRVIETTSTTDFTVDSWRVSLAILQRV